MTQTVLFDFQENGEGEISVKVCIMLFRNSRTPKLPIKRVHLFFLGGASSVAS
jgi:hypothetical protein